MGSDDEAEDDEDPRRDRDELEWVRGEGLSSQPSVTLSLMVFPIWSTTPIFGASWATLETCSTSSCKESAELGERSDLVS